MSAKSKKVLFLTPQPFFLWRGSPIRVDFNVQALAASGYQVDLLAMPVGEDLCHEGVNLMRVPNVLGVKSMPIGPSGIKAFYDIFLFFKALSLALRNKYAVIHAVEDAGALAVVIAGLTGAKVVFEKHSDPASYRKGWVRNAIMWIYSKVENFSIRHASAVIGTGPALVEHARKINPRVPVHHIFDIPSSLAEVKADEARKVREELQGSPDERLVTYVGSFAVYQGIDLMFESIPPVIRNTENIRFVIIGGSETEITERQAWLKEQGVQESVSFLGKIPPDDLPNVLAASDILLSPRISGSNTPLKLLDYLKAGRAIVACDNTANRLILDDDKAILVAPEPEAFARGIGELLADEQRRERMAAKGKDLIADKYNFEEFKERLKACYDGLVTPSQEEGRHESTRH